jgi:hypothetical protein
MPAVRLASFTVERMDLQLSGDAGAVFQIMRNSMEHVFHEGTLSRVQPSVAVDVVSAVQSMVAA